MSWPKTNMIPSFTSQQIKKIARYLYSTDPEDTSIFVKHFVLGLEYSDRMVVIMFVCV